MKKLIVLPIFLIILFSGCSANPVLPQKVNMDQLAVIQLLGIDKTPDDNIRLTVLERDIEDVEFGSSSGESGSSESDYAKKVSGNIFAEAKTMAKAKNQLQIKTQKDLFFGHMGYCIIGESLSNGGLYEYVDYIIHESVIPLNTAVYIAKTDAKDLMEKADKMKYFLPDYLDVFLNNKNISFTTAEKTILDFYAESSDDQKTAVLPLISVSGDEYPQPELKGYAVFKDYKNKIYIEDDAAKGYNILHNLYNNENIEIKVEGKERFALSVDYVSTDIRPILENGELKKVQIDCKIKSSISEDNMRNTLTNSDSLTRAIEREQQKIIEGYLKSVLEQSQKEGYDIIELFKRVRIQDKKYYERVSDNWEQIYKNVRFEMSIDSEIEGGNDLHSGKEG